MNRLKSTLQLVRSKLAFSRGQLIGAGYLVFSWLILWLIVLLQFNKYGLFQNNDRLLGFDSNNYVFVAKLVQTKGLLWVSGKLGPHLYQSILAGLGYLTGDLIWTERILPIVVAMILVYAMFKLARIVTSNLHVAGLTAILTAVWANLYVYYTSDSQSQTLALTIMFLSFPWIGNTLTKGLKWRTLLGLLLVSFAIEFTHYPLYFVFAAAVFFSAILLMKWKAVFLLPTLLISFVVYVMVQPRVLGYTAGYFTTETLQGVFTQFTWDSSLDYLGLPANLTQVLFLPIIVIGVAYLAWHARRSSSVSTLLTIWTVILLAASLGVAMGAPTAIPFSRALYLQPTPLILSIGLYALVSGSLGKIPTRLDLKIPATFLRRFLSPNLKKFASLVISAIMAASLLSVSVPRVSSAYISFLTEEQVTKLKEISSTLRNQNGVDDAVLVFYGPEAMWMEALYWSYLGYLTGDYFYRYYGLLQPLLFMVPPTQTVSQSLDPVSYRLSYLASATYWADLKLQGIQDRQTLYEHHIIVVTPTFYSDRLPPAFSRFHVGNGIYIIDPVSLTEDEANTWIIDSSVTPYWATAYWKGNYEYDWMVSEYSLEKYDPDVNAHFNLTHLVYMSNEIQYTMNIHYKDLAPDTRNVYPDLNPPVPFGPVNIYVGKRLVANITYSNTEGPMWLNITLPTLGPGLQSVEIVIPNGAVGIFLDFIAIHPSDLAIEKILSTYNGTSA